jgi:hypothetical protein
MGFFFSGGNIIAYPYRYSYQPPQAVSILFQFLTPLFAVSSSIFSTIVELVLGDRRTTIVGRRA